MAFNRTAAIGVGTGATTVLTVPVGKTWTMIDCSCANVEPSGNQVYATVRHIQGATTVNLIKAGPVPAGSAMVVVGAPRKVVMIAGDQLVALADRANAFDISVSYLEQP
jgi:hypothetical protein